MGVDLGYLGIQPKGTVHYNLDKDALATIALEREGLKKTKTGAIWNDTRPRTGRSAKDKFLVDDSTTHDIINWNSTNQPVDEATWDRLYGKITTFFSEQDHVYVLDAAVGFHKTYRKNVRVIEENASQVYFLMNMLVDSGTLDHGEAADFTVLAASNCKLNEDEQLRDGSEVFILVNFAKSLVIIGGSRYAGERKKSVFSYMNHTLPAKNVCPMHCSANVGSNGDTAIFFGLSGTGKTTLSADPDRALIGDDEHAWTPEGEVFNFEGGCYAKTIDLRKEKEPIIWDAFKEGALVENVVIKEEANELGLDFDDTSMTPNGRVSYPLSMVPNLHPGGVGNNVKTVIFLTADAFGVLPPISKLNREQAMYHYLSGFTSKLAGTEVGINEPQPTFSAYFGDPFFALMPMVYAELLAKRLDENPDANVFLVNTGWNGTGKRMDLSDTRAMVTAAMNGDLNDVEYVTDPIFNVAVPQSCPGVSDQSILTPENTYTDKEEYKTKANKLAVMFRENIRSFAEIDQKVLDAGPSPVAQETV